MDDLTKTVGLNIRDTIRTDATILSLLGITSDTAKNYIFLTTPKKQTQGFSNPRLVVVSKPSNVDEIANTGIYRGTESFQISLWVDDTPYSTAMQILDRIATLFNNTTYAFTGDQAGNVGRYLCSNKLSFPDPDKEGSTQGTLDITLRIGGI